MSNPTLEAVDGWGGMEEPANVETCVRLAESCQWVVPWGLRADMVIDRPMGHIQSGASRWEWYPSREERGWESPL